MVPDEHTPLHSGKIQPELLGQLLAMPRTAHPDVLVGPCIGEDAAVLRSRDGCVVVTSDPITFPTPRPGWYVVHVNANDIAVMGGTPQFMTLTVMMPPGSTVAQVKEIVRQCIEAADSLGIVLVGGHTEITPAVNTPVLSGTMFGELRHERHFSTADGQPDDTVVQVGPLAVEGTSILAYDHRESLSRQFGEELVTRAAGFLVNPGISVVRPALLAGDHLPVHAMHDPTEGGIATGLREIAVASRCGILLDRDKLIVAPETITVCRHAGVDPLGLLASGCLLLTLPPEWTLPALELFRNNGLQAAAVATLTREDEFLVRTQDGRTEPLPEFAVDQMTGE